MKPPSRSVPAASKPLEAGLLWRPALGYLALACGLVVAGVVLWLSTPTTPNTTEPSVAMTPTPNPNTPAATSTAINWPPPMPVATSAAAATILPEGDADPTRDLSSYVMRGEKPSMPEVIERLHKAGVYTGLGAFSPPGTRPPLIGLAVPEDFVLPEGYVRHHQATDDGQRIEAILMFAPDRQFFDAANRPIAVPANRVVPPEYAPAGMPIRRIVLPKPIDPAGN